MSQPYPNPIVLFAMPFFFERTLDLGRSLHFQLGKFVEAAELPRFLGDVG